MWYGNSFRLHSCPFYHTFQNIVCINFIHCTDCHRFLLHSSKAQTRMRERSNQSGWSGDHPWPSKAHDIPNMEVITLQPYTFYSLSLQMLQMMENSNLTFLKRGWQGNIIPMAWSTFGVYPMSKSLGNQIGQCDLFLNSNCQVSR